MEEEAIIAEQEAEAFLQSQEELLMQPMAMSLPSSPSNLALAINSSTNTNSVVEIEIGYPATFSNRVELYATTNLVQGSWSVVSPPLVTTGSATVVWEDIQTNLAFRAYRAGDADLDSDSDLVVDARELVLYGSNPQASDSDSDGMRDDYEVMYGLNPTNAADAYMDSDGDGIPNLYEYMNGVQNPTNSPLQPQPHAVASTSGLTIQAAIDAAVATSNAYPMVLLEPGTYTGTSNKNIVLDYPEILIYGTNAQSVIDCEEQANSRAFSITNGRAMLCGLGIENGYYPNGPGTDAGNAIYIGEAEAVIRDCVFVNNGDLGNNGGAVFAYWGTLTMFNCVFQGNEAYSGGGVYGHNERTLLVNCTFVDNYASHGGGAINGGQVRNCLAWGNSAGSGEAQIYWATVSDSCVEGGYAGGVNIVTNDPLLVSGFWRIASTNSSCHGTGNPTDAPLRDIDGQLRGEQVDIGADEYGDSDNDDLPDWWEWQWFTNLTYASGSDYAAGTNLYTYAEKCFHDLNPWTTDTDGDQLLDYDEIETIGTNPRNPDTDNDEMNDGYEWTYGLDPFDDFDAYLDHDGDRVPNLYEYKNGACNPTNSPGFPEPDATVGTNGTYTTIQAAIDAAVATSNAYPMVLLEPGTYTGTSNKNIVLDYPEILIYGTNAQTVVDCEEQANSRAFSITDGRAMLCGLGIENGYYPNGPGTDAGNAIYIGEAEAVIRDCVFLNNGDAGINGGAVYAYFGTLTMLNCVFQGNEAYSGGGVYGHFDRTLLVNCTFTGNRASQLGGAVFGGRLRNCIAWGNTAGASYPQIGFANVSCSCVEGGYAGGVNIVTNDPLLVHGSWRISSTNSSCYGTGNPTNAPLRDVEGELRSNGVDIGADEYGDGDNDGMVDWWEAMHNITDPNGNPDGDDYTNLDEFLNGTNPHFFDDSLADISNSLVGDGSPDPAGSASTTMGMNGSAISGSLGSWTVSGNSIRALSRRGHVEYTAAIADADIYRIEVDLSQGIVIPGKWQDYDLRISLDGTFISREKASLVDGNTATVAFDSPFLTNGNHTLQIYWDNHMDGFSLQVDHVRWMQYGGADGNSNGIKDWAENRILLRNTVERAPLSTRVSPACFVGRCFSVDRLGITGKPEILPGPNGGWYADMDLNPDGQFHAYAITYEDSGLAGTGSVRWTESNLIAASGLDGLDIRKGDSLLFSARPADGCTNGISSFYVNGVLATNGAASMVFPHVFESNGTYAVRGEYAGLDGGGNPVSLSNTVDIVVSEVEETVVAAWVGNPREVGFPDTPAGSVVELDDGISFFLDNMEVDIPEEHCGWVRQGGNGPVLAPILVKGFNVWAMRDTYLRYSEVFEDGGFSAETLIVMSPVVPEVRIEQRLWNANSFPDGSRIRTYDSSSYNSLGEIQIVFLHSASQVHSLCHVTEIYQGTNSIYHIY